MFPSSYSSSRTFSGTRKLVPQRAHVSSFVFELAGWLSPQCGQTTLIVPILPVSKIAEPERFFLASLLHSLALSHSSSFSYFRAASSYRPAFPRCSIASISLEASSSDTRFLLLQYGHISGCACRMSWPQSPHFIVSAYVDLPEQIFLPCRQIDEESFHK